MSAWGDRFDAGQRTRSLRRRRSIPAQAPSGSYAQRLSMRSVMGGAPSA